MAAQHAFVAADSIATVHAAAYSAKAEKLRSVDDDDLGLWCLICLLFSAEFCKEKVISL